MSLLNNFANIQYAVSPFLTSYLYSVSLFFKVLPVSPMQVILQSLTTGDWHCSSCNGLGGDEEQQ